MTIIVLLSLWRQLGSTRFQSSAMTPRRETKQHRGSGLKRVACLWLCTDSAELSFRNLCFQCQTRWTDKGFWLGHFSNCKEVWYVVILRQIEEFSFLTLTSLFKNSVKKTKCPQGYIWWYMIYLILSQFSIKYLLVYLYTCRNWRKTHRNFSESFFLNLL